MKIITWLKELTAMEIAKLTIALFHCALCLHSFVTLGAFIELNDLSTWEPIVIFVYTILFLICLRNVRWYYYAYIFLALFHLIAPKFLNTDWMPLQAKFFPFYLVFSLILLFDLRRVITLAYRNRSTKP
jgi:hypothetical protein